ncbi:hypothetical protein CEQ90_00325 [Lewinellaceae bacterium SD302]|nr:hypothetical protein CEQ90_00325 [Lewinellaceae bacterium SD302]
MLVQILPRHQRTLLLSLVLLIVCCSSLSAQNISCGGANAFQILHFTKTNGFDHGTRNVSNTMFSEIGTTENFTVVNSQNANVFDDLNTLLGYEVIIFSNTSGNNLLDQTQRDNVEAYMAAGGAFLGIHAATDTYRNQSWPFYNQLVGGIVQSGPNHTANNYPGTMDVIGSHPSTVNLPNPWEKPEEYYYWELNGGQLDPNIVETLRVRETGPESYDAARPISWYQTFAEGGRSYYSALGHGQFNYTDPDNDFRQLMRDALCWCVEADATLPVAGITADLSGSEGGETVISYEISGNGLEEIRLYGGVDQTELLLLERRSEQQKLAGRFLHHRPAESRQAAYFYRIETTDADGHVFRSNWIISPPTTVLTASLTWRQSGELQLRMSGLTKTATRATIVDMNGRKVHSFSLRNGFNEIGYTSLKSGQYAIIFEDVQLSSLALTKL